MGITIDELSSRYPRLFHMADSGSWPSILRHGLLSTTALLDLFAVSEKQRLAIESIHRPESVKIEHPNFGSAIIRDQKPMRPSALARCLAGCTPEQWYKFLNGRVFFWVTEARVETLLNARAYRMQEHIVITVDTISLLKDYEQQVLLSPINSGSTIYRPVSRGLASFQPPASYPFLERKKLRGLSHAVAELAIDYAVKPMRKHVLSVEVRNGPNRREVFRS